MHGRKASRKDLRQKPRAVTGERFGRGAAGALPVPAARPSRAHSGARARPAVCCHSDTAAGIVALISAAATSSGSATWVAIVAIISGAVVGVGAPLVSGRFQQRVAGKTIQAERERLHEELAFRRGEADRAELRSILDELAEYLFLVEDESGTIRNLAAWVMTQGDSPELGVSLQAARDRMRQASAGVTRQIERLQLRLGPEGKLLADLAKGTVFAASDVRAGSTNPIDDQRMDQIRADSQLATERRAAFVKEALNFTAAQLFL
jgi:hypothetical protein